jgi:carboxyl-terminal processing protease
MPKRNLIWTVAIVAAAVVALVVLPRRTRHTVTGVPVHDALPRALRVIEERYLYELDPDEVRQAMVEAMVQHLDEHSTYFPPKAAALLDARVDGRAFGLGLRVSVRDGRLWVVGALPGSPASRANLAAGEQIVAIDGRPTADLPASALAQAAADLEHATRTVRLAVARPPGRPRPCVLKPGSFRIESVQGLCRNARGRWLHRLGDARDVLYVAVGELLPDTPQQVRRVLRRFERARRLILDLRDDPGGHLPTAVALADVFLREGRIVTVERRGRRIEHHEAHAPDTFPLGVPMVVLIDSHTASGAELVAGALQHHGRAVLLGERTCGKGCVQSMISLGELGRLNLTTAEFTVDPLRPISRREGGDRWGVDPDVQQGVSAAVRQRLRRLRRRSEVMPPPGATTRPAGAATRPTVGVHEVLRLDTPLARALALVRDDAEMARLLERAAEARAERRAAAEADHADP